MDSTSWIVMLAGMAVIGVIVYLGASASGSKRRGGGNGGGDMNVLAGADCDGSPAGGGHGGGDGGGDSGGGD
ncbi:hypothetical protein [Ensifer soli]|uniref:hypothetical protein n=1 Tax=Ciceribacter sp. sgz301302 TaxID=3342379 RepID=UPI0035B70F48